MTTDFLDFFTTHSQHEIIDCLLLGAVFRDVVLAASRYFFQEQLCDLGHQHGSLGCDFADLGVGLHDFLDFDLMRVSPTALKLEMGYLSFFEGASTSSFIL